MKPETMFIKMFYSLPQEAREELVFDAYGKNPMTLNVIAIEVKNDTKLSKKILNKLGYKTTADNTDFKKPCFICHGKGKVIDIHLPHEEKICVQCMGQGFIK